MDRPGITLVRTPSRDSRVSCETLSKAVEDALGKQDYIRCRYSSPLWGGGGDTYNNGENNKDNVDDDRKATEEDDDEDEEGGGGVRGDSQATGMMGFSCFHPRWISNPTATPKRKGGGGGACVVVGGIPMMPYSPSLSPLHASASSPMRLSTGTPIGGLKSGSTHRGHQYTGPCNIIPPDIVGRKKPPGYESEGPTSPEVTCLGRVRPKPKSKPPTGGGLFRMPSKWRSFHRSERVDDHPKPTPISSAISSTITSPMRTPKHGVAASEPSPTLMRKSSKRY